MHAPVKGQLLNSKRQTRRPEMDSKKTLKQIMEFQKSMIENTYSVITNLTEQNDKMLRSFIDQSQWIPEEGRKLIKEWGDVYRKGSKDLKKSRRGELQDGVGLHRQGPRNENRQIEIPASTNYCFDTASSRVSVVCGWHRQGPDTERRPSIRRNGNGLQAGFQGRPRHLRV